MDDLSPEVHYYTVGLDDYSMGKFKFEIKKQQDGYIVEGLIPLTALEKVPGMGERMGLQLYASDVDDLENLRKTTYHWNHFDNSYKNPLGFENIILTGTGEKVNNYAVKAYLEDKEKVHVIVFSSSIIAPSEGEETVICGWPEKDNLTDFEVSFLPLSSIAIALTL